MGTVDFTTIVDSGVSFSMESMTFSTEDVSNLCVAVS